jgi:hypothetical protein
MYIYIYTYIYIFMYIYIGLPCGGANLICPPGAGFPTVVPAGFYSNEDSLENFR